jgi:hypothetical protein
MLLGTGQTLSHPGKCDSLLENTKTGIAVVWYSESIKMGLNFGCVLTNLPA